MKRDYLATVLARYVPKDSGPRAGRKERTAGKYGGRPDRMAAFVKALAGIWHFFG
jgi:hypothetical protein